jgi:hypothetical protein
MGEMLDTRDIRRNNNGPGTFASSEDGVNKSGCSYQRINHSFAA